MSAISRFLWSFLIICCFFYPAHFLAQGISFRPITWEEALRQANAEGKMIFLDAVTSWCGPCRIMGREVFPDPMLTEFFDRHFVSIKLDMEKAEGIDVSNKYKVWVYPTLLFVDSSGKLWHRVVGYQSAPELLSMAKTALDPANNLAGLEMQYAAGNRKRDFMLQLLKAKTLAYDENTGQLANDFLKTEDSLDTPENMDLIYQHVDDPYSRGFRFLLKNRADFEEKYGKRPVKIKIESVFEAYMAAHPGLQLGEIQRLYGTIYPERGEELASRYRLQFYRQQKDPVQFALAAIDHYQRFPSEDPEELNEIAWLFSEEVDDPKQLHTALDWANKAVAKHETAYYQYTLGKLWLKLGKKKAARVAAERALELAKAEGEDTMLMEDLLEATLKKG